MDSYREEILSGELDKYKKVVFELSKQNAELKAENERLKAKIKDLNFYIDSYRQVWEVDKYKQCLKEIKELITNNDNYFTEQILQKISEV